MSATARLIIQTFRKTNEYDPTWIIAHYSMRKSARPVSFVDVGQLRADTTFTDLEQNR